MSAWSLACAALVAVVLPNSAVFEGERQNDSSVGADQDNGSEMQRMRVVGSNSNCFASSTPTMAWRADRSTQQCASWWVLHGARVAMAVAASKLVIYSATQQAQSGQLDSKLPAGKRGKNTVGCTGRTLGCPTLGRGGIHWDHRQNYRTARTRKAGKSLRFRSSFDLS